MDPDAIERAFASTTPRGLVSGPFSWPTFEDRTLRARALADEEWQARQLELARDWERLAPLRERLRELGGAA